MTSPDLRPSPALRLSPALALLGPLLLAGCATGPEVPARVQAASSDPLAIEWVHAYTGKDGIAVNGTVIKPPHRPAPVPGAIEVSARLADGSVVATREVRWDRIAQRGSRRAAFSAHVPLATPAAVQSVNVRYVDGTAPADQTRTD